MIRTEELYAGKWKLFCPNAETLVVKVFIVADWFNVADEREA